MKFIWPALLALMALPAAATIDCRALEDMQRPAGTRFVMVYHASASSPLAPEDARELRKKVNEGLLWNYMQALATPDAPVKRLVLVLCANVKSKTSLTRRKDLLDLEALQVALAIWRAQIKGGRAVIGSVVIPHIQRAKDVEPPDLEVVLTDSATGDDPVLSWTEALASNRSAVTALLGLSLGLYYLDQKRDHMAMLVLCQSRKDLARVQNFDAASGQSSRDLESLLAELQAEALTKSASPSAQPDAELQKRIKLACAP